MTPQNEAEADDRRAFSPANPNRIDWSTQFATRIRKFEYWQGKAELLEAIALKQAKGDDFRASKLLQDNFAYRQACANRDGAQKRAIMYGIAAVLQQLRGAGITG